MSWKRVQSRDYLYRKTDETWRSLGVRSAETEQTFERFRSGRRAVRDRIASLDRTIKAMARVNRALLLGRVPWEAALIIRRLERKRLLGSLISVVGTHALYAYERMAGGHLHSSQLATRDIDFLFDARRQVRLLAPELRDGGMQALLRSTDQTFEPVLPGAFRAVNDKGFMVDLIVPMPRQPSLSRPPARIGTNADDLTAAEIEGLAWLQNAPQIEQVVIDERGYPLTIHAPDPRAFALHKLWVSERRDRDPVKAERDLSQAIAVAGLVEYYLPALDFEGSDLSALPDSLRSRSAELLMRARSWAPAEEGW